MTADTTQPAGSLPEPAGQIRLPGAFGLACDGYTADQMRAMMAERDAAREERDIEQAFRAKHLKERDALRRSRDAAVRAMDAITEQKSFFMRELDAMKLRAADVEGERAANAALTAEVEALRRELEELRAIPPDAREGREPQWISVEERLPAVNEPVLFYRAEGFCYGWRVTETEWTDDSFQDRDGYPVACWGVTHWMPRPAAPVVPIGPAGTSAERNDHG